MEKRYGLWTAIGMVVGTVIGSGVFFKAQSVLGSNGGNMQKSLLTVLLVGLVMLVSSYCFSLLASKEVKVNGLVDYSEIALGGLYAYGVGWFVTTVFYPTLTSCLAWISASYTLELFGVPHAHWGWHFGLAFAYLLLSFALNVFSPSLSGKIQVSTTVIKLVPLVLMAIVGTAAGLFGGAFSENLTSDVASAYTLSSGGVLGAAVSFAFAFEGWIFATCINSELKDPKKDLPRALLFGALVVIAVYLGYFLGIFGALTESEIMSSENLPRDAFSKLFGSRTAGTVAYAVVVISCLGTMNGLVLVSCRGIYSVAVRGEGPMPEYFSYVDPRTNMPTRSAIFGLFITLIWLLQWQIGFINGDLPRFLSFENDELPIISFYAFCIPIYIYVMREFRDLGAVKRFVIPSLAVASSVFMVLAAVYKYRIETIYYLSIFAIFTAVGMLFFRVNGETVGAVIYKKLKNVFSPERKK